MFSAHDPILGTTFAAPTEEALTKIMNHPKFVQWRNSIRERALREAALIIYGPQQIQAAQDKRASRNAKRLLHRNG